MKLVSLFTDGVVLQRDAVIPVWGQGAPHSKITAFLAGKQAFAAANDAGDFILRIPPVPAGGPYELTVVDWTTGKKVVVKDILIGEVWLTSGQSNMEFFLCQSGQMEDFNKQLENPEMIRIFKAPTRYNVTIGAESIESEWKYATPENVKDISAVSLWFASELRKKLNVPVGILTSAVGGTDIQAWISRASMLRNEKDRAAVTYFDSMANIPELWDMNNPSVTSSRFVAEVRDLMKQTGVQNVGNSKWEEGWAKEDFDDSAWKNIKLPGSWVVQKISGNGSIWIRSEIDIPAEWQGHSLVLNLGGIDKHDVSYFNNTEIGRTGKDFETAYWDTPRHYTIPANLVKAGKNVIAIRAYSFALDGGFGGKIEDYNITCPDLEKSIQLPAEWKAGVEYDLGAARFMGYTAPAPGNPNSPAMLFNTMIKPLIPFAIRGALWYQGENNAISIPEAKDYERRMKLLISDWRQLWEQGDFPFYQVQLAPYGKEGEYQDESSWAHLRESQRKAAETTPNSGMAVIMDAGNPKDIHPTDKKTVGERLARLALHDVYNQEDIIPNGPLYDHFVQEAGKLRIHFRNGKGLHSTDGAALKGFVLAGLDKVFKPAKAEIDGTTIVLSSDEVAAPFYARYAWAESPVTNLANEAGLPASSFSTEE